MQKLLKSAALGGAIVYLWGVVSWMALPWHHRVLHAFEHDVDVVRMLDFGTPASGVYVYPPSALTDMKRGMPLAFVSFSKEGPRPMGHAIALGLCLQILGALILSWFISKTSGFTYLQKVAFAAAFGLAVGILGSGPNWVWWNFAPDFTLVTIVDSLIAWTLAGLALGKVL